MNPLTKHMKKITLIAKFQIHSGKEAEFKGTIPYLIELVKAKEPGAERYEWYFDASGSTCHIIETYSDSNAVMAHMVNCGEMLGKLMSIADLSGDIYGPLSDEVKAAMGALPVKQFSFHLGI